jgi:3-hydroxyisobutyrate dehydrogenase
MQIAFIGLGNMGLPMALNLVKAGHAVKGFDLAEVPMQTLAAAGGRRARGVADAVDGAELVVTMLPASKHVEGLYFGDDGVLARAPKSALLIDCSTIAPTVAREVAVRASAQGFAMLDAPVSGGTNGAQAGTLTFMVGGAEADVERARPVLSNMGKNIFHAGPSGCGQTVKVCNNMLLGVLMLGTCEALQLGIANGMDPTVLSEIMGKSSGANWALQVYNPCPGVMPAAPASRGYTGGFAVDLMLKDLGLAVESAKTCETPVPMGGHARQLYATLSQAGHGGLDFSSAFEKLHSR